jgi:hypothetical protein
MSQPSYKTQVYSVGCVAAHVIDWIVTLTFLAPFLEEKKWSYFHDYDSLTLVLVNLLY